MSELARTIAAEAHASQRDKLGRDYVDAHLRPIAEAAAVFGPEAEAAGWLHDVLEDTEISAADLREHGIPEHVIDAIESVTKVPGQEYDELIAHTCQHPLGRLVKLVDNAWNIACNPALAQVKPDKAHDLMTRKYLPARERLLAACELDADSPEALRVDEILHSHLVRLHAGG
ncbi:phosphohydrolase [Nocardioides sp. Soil805]|uniref:phosphohydrolase n=1 Tax=Nocardioides sp. Soil805 TaxID=1736416 RepID=UPI0007025336|nr:phosphohydrolase [Nocardioides sp. Soil805]KRF37377.1 phosphohydrolase [Nocardioides sp. Soil805]